MKKIKEFFKKNKKIISAIISAILFILSNFAWYLVGYIQAIDDVNKTCDNCIKNESNKRMNGKVSNKVGRNMLLDVDDFTNNNIGTRTNYGLYTTSIGSSGGSTWSYIYAVTTLSKGYYNYSFTATADNTNLRTGIRIYQDGSSSMWVNTIETLSSTKTYKGTIQITSSSLKVRFDLLRNYFGTGYSGNVIWSIMLTQSDYDSGYNAGYDSGYDVGYEDGYSVGESDVMANPNNYDLYTQNQYNQNYINGQNSVINNPNNYGLYTEQQYDNNYDVGYDNGITSSDSYEVGYESGYNTGYDNGFTSGVESAINPLVGFNDTFINYGYFTDLNELYLVDSNVSLPINANTYLLNDYVDDTREERSDNGGYNENGRSLISITGFTPFIDNTLQLNSTGFYQIQYYYNDNTIGSVNISNVRDYTDHIINNNKFVKEIVLYFNADEFMPNYILNLYLNNNYQDGYTNGYNQGYSNGENNVIKNPNDYDLYTENQYIDYGESKEQYGINVGQSMGCSLNQLFYSIADIPIQILSRLMSFELFGFNLFNAFASLITIGLLIFVIKFII